MEEEKGKLTFDNIRLKGLKVLNFLKILQKPIFKFGGVLNLKRIFFVKCEKELVTTTKLPKDAAAINSFEPVTIAEKYFMTAAKNVNLPRIPPRFDFRKESPIFP